MFLPQKVLSNIDIYTGVIEGTEIPLPQLRVNIVESFVLKKRMSNNPKDYAYEDYKINFHQPFQQVQDYIRDHFSLYYKKILTPTSYGVPSLLKTLSFVIGAISPQPALPSRTYRYAGRSAILVYC